MKLNYEIYLNYMSMDLCVSSLALAASLTSQYWSNWSRGRLPDLGWCELPTRPHTWGRLAWRQTELARRPVPPVSPRCTEEPLVEPLRTAVSAEMAKSGHTLQLHLPSVGVMNPSWARLASELSL